VHGVARSVSASNVLRRSERMLVVLLFESGVFAVVEIMV